MHPAQYHENREASSGKLALSIAQAVEATSLARSTLYRRIGDGSLATVRVGGRRLIPMASLEALLKVEAA